MVKKKFFINILAGVLFLTQFFGSVFSMDDGPGEVDFGCCYGSTTVDRGRGQEEVLVGDILKITNSTGDPLQVSIKAGGQFVEARYGGIRRDGQEGTAELLFGVLNPGQEIFVDRNKFTVLTFRIWLHNPVACFNYYGHCGKSLSRKLDLYELAGLRSFDIRLNKTEKWLKVHFNYDFTQSPECVLCYKKFIEESCNILVLSCGHYYHAACCQQRIKDDFCPMCRQSIIKGTPTLYHDSDFYISDVRKTIESMLWQEEK